ncbi:MAG: rhodanese-like domain-containing protein [Chloracidobacterium sp.]|nr:rhodanese-like domain-containing protein [Chloracidobacterium sp.]
MWRHMPMKYWRRLVKNRNILQLAVLFLAISSLGFQADCDSSKVAPYVKYNSDADVPRITIEEAKKEFDAGNVVIVDSRGEAQYKQEHIAGALNVPFGAPDNPKFSEIPKGKKIIVYCS